MKRLAEKFKTPPHELVPDSIVCLIHVVFIRTILFIRPNNTAEG
jgi:hypothetical protein